MLSDVAIKVDSVSKCFQIYDHPQDRLKQFFLPRFQRVLGLKPREYFRGFWALNNISLEIKKGETVGIVGRNGSGKSTLLQIICGTLSPTSGNIQTFGRIAALLELGSGFNGEFTGHENVYMNAALLGLSELEIHERFDQIAAFADIGDFMWQPVKTYSSGMQMRLAFAVSVCIDPNILIVDEALAVGDMAFQQKCFDRLANLQESGTTILMVSHDIMLIRNYCEKAIYLDSGLIKNIGDAETIGEFFVRDMFSERQGNEGGAASLVWRNGEAGEKVGFGSSRGRVTKVCVGGLNDAKGVFGQGEMICVEIQGEVAADILYPEFVFQLRDARGYVLYGIPTQKDEIKVLADGDTKRVSARLKLNLDLGQGNYAVSISLNDRQGDTVFAILDKVVAVAEFSVVQNVSKRSHGCIDLKSTWE